MLLTKLNKQKVFYNPAYWSICYVKEHESCREVSLYNEKTREQETVFVSDTFEELKHMVDCGSH